MQVTFILWTEMVRISRFKLSFHMTVVRHCFAAVPRRSEAQSE